MTTGRCCTVILVIVLALIGCHHTAPATMSSPAASTSANTTVASPLQPTAKTSEATLTGCLGSTRQGYILSDQTGNRYTVIGVKELDNHVAHQVMLTGTASGDTFKATQVQRLSAATCSTSK